MTRSFAAVAAALLSAGIIFLAPPAHAGPPAGMPDPYDRHLAIDGEFGIGTPFGLTGLELELTPVPWFTLGAGVGVSGYGEQEALSARAGIPFWDRGGVTRIALGGGFSTGPFEATVPFLPIGQPNATYVWHRANWANMEVSLEHRFAFGLEGRVFYGVALLTNPTADACTYDFGDTGSDWSGESESCAEAATDPHAPGSVPEATGFLVTTVPYTGVAVGFAF